MSARGAAPVLQLLAAEDELMDYHGNASDLSAPADGSRTDDLRARSRAQPAPAELAPGLRILVVDDNLDSATTLALLLRMAGHEVHLAHDGIAALEAVRGWRPQIAILDIGLPGLDGYELARRLRQEYALRDALLVALTGYGQDEDRRRAWQAGFNAHLIKPVDLHQLRALLAHAGSLLPARDPRPRD
jgi:CheY-like chemotaxis protein